MSDNTKCIVPIASDLIAFEYLRILRYLLFELLRSNGALTVETNFEPRTSGLIVAVCRAGA
jgi:hypothetical protein